MLCVLQSGVSMQAAIHEEKYVIRVLYRRDPDSSHWQHYANDWHVCLAAGLGGKRGHLQDQYCHTVLHHYGVMLHYGRSRAFSIVLLPFWMITTFPQLPNIQNVRSQEVQNLKKRNLQRLKQTHFALPHASYRSQGYANTREGNCFEHILAGMSCQ